MVGQNILGISLDENGIGYLLLGYFHVNRKSGTWRISFVDPKPTRMVSRNPILGELMTEAQRLDDVASIPQCMKEGYAIPDRHTRYVVTKEFFRTKMTEGSSMQEHGVEMLSLVEKLEDLKAGLDNVTYIDERLRRLRRKARGLDPGRGGRVRQRRQLSSQQKALRALPLLHREWARERGRWVLQRSRKLRKDEVVLRLSDGKVVVAEVVGTVNLVISDHVRLEFKIVILYLPLNTQARGRFSYFITFTDDCSRYGYVYLMRLLNIALSKAVAQTPYQIWHGKPASYKYLRVWGDPAYIKRLMGEKLDSRSKLCRSARVPQPPKRYGFLSVIGQLDNDPKTYREVISDIDSEKWLESIKSKMDSMSSNQIWTLVDQPKGVKPVRYKWVYKCKIGADGEVRTFKASLVAKGYTQRRGVGFEETFSPIAMAKSIWSILAIAAWYDYEIW
ncbi:UNVERIFIED_CONTAM: Retrovirus-related Pol polyprotein from transposon TNT 1-94 [Sesamum radiatum]|uniref:Retrovirus-related Pol polyprotein from transposon TNT 1-94 n=1 Tax=Sesamum radiatum TaxID=300843 RepID=A0AAW2S5J5_SESRA